MKWKRMFTQTIKNRGKNYARRGKVTKIAEENGKIIGEVKGSRIYHVSISYANGKVTSMTCDCPYARQAFNCKHMAALLYEWEKRHQNVFMLDIYAQQIEKDIKTGDNVWLYNRLYDHYLYDTVENLIFDEQNPLDAFDLINYVLLIADELDLLDNNKRFIEYMTIVTKDWLTCYNFASKKERNDIIYWFRQQIKKCDYSKCVEKEINSFFECFFVEEI